MSFAIIKTKKHYKKVVHFTESENAFKSWLISKYSGMLVTIIDDESNIKSLDDGLYLVFSKYFAKLVEKTTKISEGYLYNSVSPKIETLYSWELIRCKSGLNILTFPTCPTNSMVDYVKMDLDSIEIDNLNVSSIDVESNLEISVKKFRLEDELSIKPGKQQLISVIGNKGSGKTTMVDNIFKAILDKMNNQERSAFLQNTLIFACPYAHYRHKYPEATVLSAYDSNALSNYIRMHDQNDEINIQLGAIVFDDCLFENSLWAKTKSEAFLNFFFHSRHLNKFGIFTFQHPPNITPEMHCNFDHIFLLAQDFTNIQKLYEHYTRLFPNFESFKKMFKFLTKDHGCMIIDQYGYHPFQQRVKHFKASL